MVRTDPISQDRSRVRRDLCGSQVAVTRFTLPILRPHLSMTFAWQTQRVSVTRMSTEVAMSLVTLFAKKVVAGLITTTVLATGGLAGAGAIGPTRAVKSHREGRHHKVAHARRLSHHVHAKGKRFVSLIDQVHPFKVAAAVIGVSAKSLYDDVYKRGLSIADVALAHGVSPATVASALERAGISAIGRDSTAGLLALKRSTRAVASAPTVAASIVNGHKGYLLHHTRTKKIATRRRARR